MIKRKCVLLTLEMQSDPSSGGTDDAGRTGLVGALEDHGPWSAMLSRPQHSTGGTPQKALSAGQREQCGPAFFLK